MPHNEPPKESRWKPGQSGNPKGAPKGVPKAKTRYMRLLSLTEKIKNPVTGEMEDFTIMEQLDMQMIAKARRGDIQAYKEIMDRLEGKALQNIDSKVETIDTTPVLPKAMLDSLEGAYIESVKRRNTANDSNSTGTNKSSSVG